MCFGGDAPESPQLKALPPVEEMRGFVDDILKEETQLVDNPNGKGKIAVRRRLSLTPERKLMREKGLSFLKNAIANIEVLSKEYPQLLAKYRPVVDLIGDLNRDRRADMAQIANVPNFDEYVQNFTKVQERAVDEEYKASEAVLKEKFNRMGYGNSGALNEAMAVLEGRKADALVNIKGKTPAYAAELQKAYLGNTAQHMKMKETARAGLTSETAKMFGLEKEIFSDRLRMEEGLSNKGADLIKYDDNLGLHGKSSDYAFQDRQYTNNLNLQRNAQENANLTNQYNMNLQQYQNEGSGFGDMLFQGAMGLGGQFLGSGMQKAGGLWGKSLFNSWGA